MELGRILLPPKTGNTYSVSSVYEGAVERSRGTQQSKVLGKERGQDPGLGS